MKRQTLHTMEGLRDLHPYDTGKKNLIENRIRRLFRGYGYEQVETPTFEYYDVYDDERGTLEGKNLYKFFNREGEILALRPDVTPSVARYIATFYPKESLPKRFSYIGNVFYNNENYQGKLREYTQAGVECIGIASAQADAEAIALAVHALQASGLTEFMFDIGHAGYFRGLAKEIGLDQERMEEARLLIDEKNNVGLEELIRDIGLNHEQGKALVQMPTLFGQEDILDQAAAMTSSEEAQEAIQRLRDVYDLLQDYGVAEYISFDLGMVTQIQYYTGVVFKGYTYGTGDSVLDGGRYDALLGTYTYDAPAVGFAIKVDDLLNAINRQKIELDVPSIDTLIIYEPECLSLAIQLAQTMRIDGMTVELGLGELDVETAIAYGREKNIGGLVYLKNTQDVELIHLATGDKQYITMDDLMKGDN